jgi:O-antigen/teichoic acid export membrane protein
MTVLQFTLDIILVGTLIGPGAAALYGIVARVTAISRQVLQSLSEAAWPRLAQEADPERKALLMRKVDRLNAWLVGAWYGAMVVTLLPLLNWLAPNWATPPLLAVLIVSRSFVTSVINPHAYGLLSAGRFRDLAFVSQQEVLTGVVLGLLLAKPLGAVGFGIGFFVGTATASGWRMTQSYFKMAQDTHWVSELGAVYGRGITAGVVSLGLAAIAWLQLTAHFAAPGWLAVFVGGLAFAVPAGIVMIVWRSTGKIP